MAWATPPVFTVGQILTAAQQNTISNDLVALGPGGWYRKTTSKTVNTTVSPTDLLNGEITIVGGVMGASGVVRLSASGDGVQNSGGAAAPPRFQLAFGGTTQLDTGTSGTLTNSASRFHWEIEVKIFNLGATNSQWITFKLYLSAAGGVATNAGNAFTTGEGAYSSTSVAAPGAVFASGGATGAIDTTASKTLVLNVINASASATYETKLYGAFTEVT